MSGVAGFDLGEAVAKGMIMHTARKCKFKDGALERILKSPEFEALAQRIEAEESECALKSEKTDLIQVAA